MFDLKELSRWDAALERLAQDKTPAPEAQKAPEKAPAPVREMEDA
ncbi:hypothetical protein Ga0609869_000968 [Rhodovulum iodosum]|uniref:Uncharacterized protein n=1 Tax=Rhodovulum iodosum TaxID=68291 RepID=A0ABV3XS53_9RHOB|nr:hypothetical protein [Rhodovulum robiginosum]